MGALLFSLTLLMSALAIGGTGITIDLIHRDSATNSSTIRVDKLYASFQRSIARARHIRPTALTPPVDTRVFPNDNEYVIELAVGSPPTKFLAIVDTGSDLVWTPCKPCVNCLNNVFNPATSTTYQPLPCDGNACSALTSSDCSDDGNTCLYNYNYQQDGYSTSGDFATEILTIGGVGGDSFTVSNLAFGCGHDNPGFRTGLIGLGQGPLSFTSQTKSLPALGGKFAYCLVPPESDVSSKISFGENAVVSGDGVVSTPMASGEDGTFYYLTLESVVIQNETIAYISNNKKLGYDIDEGADEGNIIIDSGSTLTSFPKAMFDAIVSKLRSEIKGAPVADPGGVLKLCYRGEVEVPWISFKFRGGATLGLAPNNVFTMVYRNLYYCLAMLPIQDVDGIPSIFGNLAQINLLVGYDLQAKTVSFKGTDCTKYV